MKKYFKVYLFKYLAAIGLTPIKYLYKQQHELTKTKTQLTKLTVEFTQFKNNLQRRYPKDREVLKTLVNQNITLTGVFICKEVRGYLIRGIKLNNEAVTDHLWVKSKNKPRFKKGDLVTITGTVVKYGSTSYTKSLTEDYCLYKPSLKKDNT